VQRAVDDAGPRATVGRLLLSVFVFLSDVYGQEKEQQVEQGDR